MFHSSVSRVLYQLLVAALLLVTTILLISILGLSSPDRANKLYAQSNTDPSSYYLPVIETQVETNAVALPASKTSAFIHGVLQISEENQALLTEPWGASYQVIDPQTLLLPSYSDYYVALSGYWQDEDQKVFVATDIKTISAEGQRHSSYVRREMSNPALTPMVNTQINDTKTADSKRIKQLQAANLLANPAQVGEWSAVKDIGVYALHSVVLPDGRVMFWYRTIITNPLDPVFNTVVWDPATESLTSLTNASLQGEENWCASHVQLGDGRILGVTGLVGEADAHAALFNPQENSWSAQPDLHFGRYYPSATFMGDGRVVVSGGDYITPGTNTVPNPFPEVWENGAWRIFADPLETTPTATEFGFYYGSFYPWTQQAPNGKVFYAGPQSNLRYLDPDGVGTVTDAGERDGESRDYGSYATYDIGKVLVAGGGSSLATAYTIDYNGSTPTVAQTGAMTHGRRNFYTTILADGTVLATGGNGDGGIAQASPTGAVFAAELWDPETGIWTQMASMERRREYHSSAVLLPDGRVVHAGGDCTPCSPEANMEIFSPPYLFNADGSLATRPVINRLESIQTGATLLGAGQTDPRPEIDYGELLRLNFGAASAINKVHLIRLGSSTHSTNFDQRLVPLEYSSSGTDLTITAPRNTYIAPPGYYLLFLVSDTGVPSVATILKLGTHFEKLRESNSFHDGGFEESYTPPVGAWFSYAAGDIFGGWTVDYGQVDVQHNGSSGAGNGSDGEQNVDLNGTEPGQISQSISGFVPGKSYEIQFNYATHALTNLAEASIKIANLNQTWQATNAHDEPWLTATYSFTASSNAHTLSFAGGGPLPYAGMVIDNIELLSEEEIPPPVQTGPALTNIAVNQPATQSSQQAGWPGVAVDGNTAGDGQLNQVTRTNKEDEPWWQVDLGQNEQIEQVVVWNRTDCCADQLHDFYILASDTDLTGRTLDDILDDPAVDRVYSAGVYTTTATISITKQLQSNSRYVRVQGATNESLNLAEVQILSPPPPNQPPTIVAPSTQQHNVTDSISLAVAATDPENEPLTFSATNLPAGLTIAPSSGLISGALSAAGTYNVTLTAEDIRQGSDSVSFMWIVNGPPSITNPGDQFSTLNDAITLPIIANDDDNASLLFSSQNLPAGLAIDPASGVISGTISAAGTFTVSIQVTDSNNSSDSTTFVWNVNNPPQLTTPSNQTNIIGDTVNLAISANDADGDSLTYSAGNLPPNLALNPTSGVIAGTVNAAGLYTVLIIVSDGNGGSATASFEWTVDYPPNNPPTLINPGNQSSTVEDNVQLSISASDTDNDPLSITADGLPGGLTLIEASALISGTAISPGTYPVTITVNDGNNGTASANFIWTVNGMPDITFPGDQSGTVGDLVSLAILATDFEEEPLIYRATNLPATVAINSSTGQLTGTLDQAGVFNVEITVDDGRGGLSSVQFIWTVNEPANQLPVLTLIPEQNHLLGSTVMLATSAVDPDGDPLTFSAENLPTGVNIDPVSGEITGTATVAGSYNVTISVNDGRGGTDSINFTWLINTIPNNDPSVSNPGPQEHTVGESVVLSVTATDQDGDVLSIQLTNLPPGLSSNQQTGVISGTVNRVGVYEVQYTAYDGNGGSAGTTFTWRVNPPPNIPPTINDIPDQINVVGDEISLSVQVADDNGDALSIQYTNLPPGLSGNQQTGTISGIVNMAGVYEVQVTVSDSSGGSADTTFNWRVDSPPNSPPTINNIPNQINTVGDEINLPIQVADDDGDALSIQYTDLPPGLSGNQQTGTISGVVNTAGVYIVQVTVSDGSGGSTKTTFNWRVNPTPNSPPTIDDIPEQINIVGDQINLSIRVADDDDDVLSYHFVNLPSGLSGNQQTGTISGAVDKAKIYTVQITVSDGRGGSARTTFNWRVNPPPNSPPTINDIPEQINIVGDQVNLTIQVADDNDDDVLSFHFVNLPSGLSADEQTGTISGAVDKIKIYTVQVTVSDGRGGSARTTFNWRVNPPPNNPPTIDDIPDQINTVGDEINLPIQVADDDGDALSIKYINLPAGLSGNQQTGTISGIVNAFGVYTVQVTVSDSNDGSASTTFNWRVNPPPNTPPIVSDIPDQVNVVGDEVNMSINAVDQDGNSLRFTVENLPSGLTIDGESGQISGMVDSAGVYTTTISVDDGNQGIGSNHFVWRVEEVEIVLGAAPTLTNPGPQQAQVGIFVSLTVDGIFSENSQIIYAGAGLPPGLSVDSASGIIEGIPTQTGEYVTVISVRDEHDRKNQVVFKWVVAAALPDLVEELPKSFQLFLPITYQPN